MGYTVALPVDYTAAPPVVVPPVLADSVDNVVVHNMAVDIAVVGVVSAVVACIPPAEVLQVEIEFVEPLQRAAPLADCCEHTQDNRTLIAEDYLFGFVPISIAVPSHHLCGDSIQYRDTATYMAASSTRNLSTTL